MDQGNRIRLARIVRGWSQKELAESLRVSQAEVARWEGARAPRTSGPRADLLSRLAEKLGVSPLWLKHGWEELTPDALAHFLRPTVDMGGKPRVLPAPSPPVARRPDLRIYRVDGTDMSPTLNPGDWVVVNIVAKSRLCTGVYVLAEESGPFPARLGRGDREDADFVRLTFDNARFPDRHVRRGAIRILGRVLYRVTML